MSFSVDQMRTHVVFHDLRHESGHGAACAGDQMHDLLTPRLGFEGPFNSLDLSSNTADARQQLLLVANRMTHRLILA